MTKVGDLSNDELLDRLHAHVGRGNAWLVGLLAYLAELDARRLYAEQACTSTWDYCVRRLGMSEGEAQRRIAVARLVRSFPMAGGYLERGAIHLCALYEMHKHITPDNHEELLREAMGKTTKAVAAMIAARFPRADVHACIEPLAPQPALPIATREVLAPTAVPSPAVVPSQTRPRVEPLSASRYRVALTISSETKAKLERVRDLMRHRNPTGDLEKIFEVSLDLLLTKLEKERLGRTTRSNVKTRSATTDVDGAPSGNRNDATIAPRCSATRVERDRAGSSPRGDAPSAERAGTTSAERGGATSAERDGETSAERAGTTSAQRDGATRAEWMGAKSAQRGGASRAEHDSWPPRDSGPREESDRLSGLAEPELFVAAQRKTQKQLPSATSAMNEPHVEKSPSSKQPSRRGHVSRAVRREVWARDGAQCTYVDAEGNRCPARGFLELDHIEAKALGGGDDASNIRLRCRVHNHLHAEQVFGREYMEDRIHLRQRKYAPADQVQHQKAATGQVERQKPPSGQEALFETAARGLRSLGFRELEVRQVIARLAASLDPDAPVETIIRKALRLLT